MKLFRRRTSQEAKTPDVPFHHSHVIQIFPYKSKGDIKVYDLTASITTPYPSDAFKQQALRLAEALTETPPTWIIRKAQPSQGRVRTLHSSPEEDAPALASWDPSHWEHGSNDFAFPADSPHSSHALSMTRSGMLRNDGFVKDSVEYIWKCDSASRRTTTLYKTIGGTQTVVAKYATPSVFSKTGGTMVVDSGEIDLVVAILTCAGMVLKLRQASSM